jgi:hypothetical protein
MHNLTNRTARRLRLPAIGRRGSTLIEVLAGVVIMTVIVAALAPNLIGTRDAARIAEAARMLEDIAIGIHDPDAGEGSFRVDVRAWPGRLSHLNRQIFADEPNICWATGGSYSGGQLNPPRWLGPYFPHAITDAGLRIGIGTLENTIVRDDGAAHSRARIVVSGVALGDALALDRRVDLGDGQNTGAIQWTAPDSEELVDVHYVFSVRGC